MDPVPAISYLTKRSQLPKGYLLIPGRNRKRDGRIEEKGQSARALRLQAA